MKLDEVLTEDERLDMWAEMMALATAMQEYCDCWWTLDAAMRSANDRRFTCADHQQGRSEISD